MVLAARQALAKTSNPGESIEVKSVIIDGITQTINPKEYSKSFNGVADLSSRTPFARMWTAIAVMEGSPKGDFVGEEKRRDAEEMLTPDLIKEGAYVRKENGKWKIFIAKQIGETQIYIIGSNILGTLEADFNSP